MRKKSVLPLPFFFLLIMLLASCSRKAGTARRTATLKDRARILESGVEWSDDVSVLEGRVAPDFSVSPGLLQDPLAHIVTFDFSSFTGNYPVLEGFASLDTSGYSEASYSVIDGFCRALEAGRGEDSYMDKGFLFSLALFKYATGSQGQGKGMPVSHLIGKAAGDEGSLQCPVRLSYKDGSTCDIYVYLVKSVSDWKVNQIEFMKEGPEEGS